VDLRGNPGGLLTSVNDILDLLLPKGTIVYTEDKYGNRQTYTSDDQWNDVPMAVLVNGESASASEIFAGAVKDYERATLVGTQTFGKGIVQTIRQLTDGSAIKLTIARYYTPNGICIHGEGITPDIVLEYDSEAVKDLETVTWKDDNQLMAAYQAVLEKIGQ
jgi:carboxyl-terminal processing protease